MSDDAPRRDGSTYGDWRPGKQRPSETKSEFESVSGASSSAPSGFTNVIDYVRDYLSFAQPAMILIFAAVSYIASQIIGFIAIKSMVYANSNTVTTNGQVVDSGQGFAMFLAGIASLIEYGAGVLVIWAIARLIADAIARGASND
tara:strand:- start:3214 stop:3648 length:435 start_codon:yes stop_codon:yes gene_type:complete